MQTRFLNSSFCIFNSAFMNYIPHTDAERREMLARIGAKDLADLFVAVPDKYRFPKLDLPEAVTEMEVMWEMNALSDANRLSC